MSTETEANDPLDAAVAEAVAAFPPLDADTKASIALLLSGTER